MTLDITIKCHNAECRYDKCCYAECRYAECHGALISSSHEPEAK